MKGIIMRSKAINLNHTAIQKESLIRLLKDITAAIPVQYIYLHADFFTCNTLQEMLIMVSHKHVRVLNELIPVLNIVFNGQTELSYRVFHVHEVEQALRDGNLFFTMPRHLKMVYLVNREIFLSMGWLNLSLIRLKLAIEMKK